MVMVVVVVVVAAGVLAMFAARTATNWEGFYPDETVWANWSFCPSI